MSLYNTPRPKSCAHCGVEFKQLNNTQKCCSMRCRVLANVKLAESGCIEWQGATVRGYGCLRIPHKTLYAHRVSWETSIGPIPEGLHVLHRCDNRLCVNPKHLFLGTHQDNMNDMSRKGRTGNLGRVMPEEQRRKISETKRLRRAAV